MFVKTPDLWDYRQMYEYKHPKPLEISLAGQEGFALRQKAAGYLAEHENITGAQRGSLSEQSYGAVAEIVVRNKLGMPDINPAGHPLGYDILLRSGVKMDVKCRGGEKPFLEEYVGGDGLPRESKHNYFARQLYENKLDTDIYLMTHLRRAKPARGAPIFPGTRLQRSWVLYVCGWVSKKRVLREGVYLPPGAISERGREWFAYRAHEIEFYNRNLNGISSLEDLFTIEPADIERDEERKGNLNLTRVDTLRIGYDLAGRGILGQEELNYIKKEMHLDSEAGSFLHANQSIHVLKWLRERKVITAGQFEKMRGQLPEEVFTGLNGTPPPGAPL
ncbi:MAG: hypothetical protein Q8P58_02080 [Candidatus Adlerbacteria bacterium]|nr:hypothetical protein [Candidatus Adlerbacteria bacterium]